MYEYTLYPITSGTCVSQLTSQNQKYDVYRLYGEVGWIRVINLKIWTDI